MDGYLNRELMQNPGAFHPYGNIYGVEFWRSADPAKRIFRHSKIHEEDFADWLRQVGCYEPPRIVAQETGVECLRLLVCKLDDRVSANVRNWKHNGIPGTGALALSMSRAQYEDALQILNLPRNFLTILARQTAAWTRSSPDTSIEGFVLKTNSARTWHYGMASSYSASSSITTAFLLGLDESSLHILYECLKYEDMQLPLPTLLPILLMELRAQAVLQHISHSHTSIFHLEGQTGVFSDVIRRDPARESGYRLSPSGVRLGPGVRKSVDFEAVTVDLTSTITELAHATFTCDVNIKMLEDLSQLTVNMRPKTVTTTTEMARRNFSDKVAYLRSYYRGLESRTNYVMCRAQAQVQTVYSMVAQRDSAASMTLAAASRQDNLLMRKVTEDSKRVAVATSRDSASMKIIAAVTIVFLPATFVATLFSTTFFNFQQSGKVVSQWVWLYWVVTICLTVIILSTWYIFSRRKEREIESKFGGESEITELQDPGLEHLSKRTN